MEERKMTIARGLTRLKTIQAQLMKNGEVLRHSFINSKKKSPLADSRLDIGANHKEARKVVEATLQSTEDLIAEYAKIKTAIATVNLTATVTVAGKTMTLAEAMLMRREVRSMYSDIVSRCSNSLNTAMNDVNKYNDPIMENAGTSAEDKKILLAEMTSFVTPEKVNELNEFLTVFMAEVDGTLNEVNALTEITV